MNSGTITTTLKRPEPPTRAELLEAFFIFNEKGGKFRVAIVNVCNLDCFFCHNEAMANPRRDEPGSKSRRLDTDHLVRLVNAFTRLGGKQVNLTGGEPLADPNLFELLDRIEKRSTRVVLNSNVLLYERLLRRPKHPNLDSIFASLHTTDDAVFERELGGRPGSAAKVMAGIVALAKHGYDVQINYSLGPYNLDGFDEVLDFALAAGVDLKAIALVRSNDTDGFYGGDWVAPSFLSERLDARGAVKVGESQGLGGHTTTYRVGRSTVKVKNVARGRLETDFCKGCLHRARCGEGIYGLRVGVDAIMKPCLLRRDRDRVLTRGDDASYEDQVLSVIGAMVGDWSRARFVSGAPK
jgi:GTP 3',8-cyclase